MFEGHPLPHESEQSRKTWLGVLARATAAAIAQHLADAPLLPAYTVLRAPETGMAMVRGRIGGNGAAFNLGEMTIVRCSIYDAAGRIGHGYAAGRDLIQVELIARLDAVLQDKALFPAYYQAVIAPLAAVQAAARTATQAQATATEVKFFTLAAMRS
ncbi:MAG: phosphonate C-P lyase system protein PhnG [Rhodospirillales bacterium 20-64-7]|nr:MAG: phosphonate C-P lyase system protein PhnG [Rhodospirillales bacterium 20-64-7]